MKNQPSQTAIDMGYGQNGRMPDSAKPDYGMPEKTKLPFIHRLCKEFEKEGIEYCHWKSNAMIDRSESGDNDLDLLIARTDADRFMQILFRFGFKELRTTSKRALPGVLDYFGYDEDNHKLVHVHAHFRLILGHDATKNYHLPIENAYLFSSSQEKVFRIPACEFEFIVFVIRMVLKHSTWDAILFRQGHLSRREQEELDYLRTRADRSLVLNILKKNLPCIHADLFDRCLRSLHPDCPYRMRIRAGSALQRSLRGHAVRPQISDIGLKIWRQTVNAIKRRLFEYKPVKRSNSGGLIVAIVGGDGSGKSTVVESLHRWLSPRFSTIRVHMGKPDWSLTTTVVRGVLKICRLAISCTSAKAQRFGAIDSKSPAFARYSELLAAVCAAHDRYHTYAKARRRANRGAVAICDRLPLPGLKFMDGPRIEQIAANHSGTVGWAVRLLSKLERKYYAQILPPELLILLKVDPETAVQRKTDEDSVYVRARSALVWEIDWRQVQAHVIDGGQPKADVLSDVKWLVWSAL
jgi:thymidylate kinase